MAETDEKRVRKVIQNYIDGTYQADVQALRTCFHPKAVMNGFLGKQLLLGDPEPFFQDIGGKPAMAATGAPYKGEITLVHIAGRTAAVTLRETGFGGGLAFTDFFHLIEENGQWKIISKTFTTE
jgi:hypothetical protein